VLLTIQTTFLLYVLVKKKHLKHAMHVFGGGGIKKTNCILFSLAKALPMVAGWEPGDRKLPPPSPLLFSTFPAPRDQGDSLIPSSA